MEETTVKHDGNDGDMAMPPPAPAPAPAPSSSSSLNPDWEVLSMSALANSTPDAQSGGVEKQPPPASTPSPPSHFLPESVVDPSPPHVDGTQDPSPLPGSIESPGEEGVVKASEEDDTKTTGISALQDLEGNEGIKVPEELDGGKVGTEVLEEAGENKTVGAGVPEEAGENKMGSFVPEEVEENKMETRDFEKPEGNKTGTRVLEEPEENKMGAMVPEEPEENKVVTTVLEELEEKKTGTMVPEELEQNKTGTRAMEEPEQYTMGTKDEMPANGTPEQKKTSLEEKKVASRALEIPSGGPCKGLPKQRKVGSGRSWMVSIWSAALAVTVFGLVILLRREKPLNQQSRSQTSSQSQEIPGISYQLAHAKEGVDLL